MWPNAHALHASSKLIPNKSRDIPAIAYQVEFTSTEVPGIGDAAEEAVEIVELQLQHDLLAAGDEFTRLQRRGSVKIMEVAQHRGQLDPFEYIVVLQCKQLRFPLKLLDMRPVLADPLATRQAIELCERELAQLGTAGDSTMIRVCAELVQAKNGGYPDQETIAGKLHMSSRTLARKLRDKQKGSDRFSNRPLPP